MYYFLIYLEETHTGINFKSMYQIYVYVWLLP